MNNILLDGIWDFVYTKETPGILEVPSAEEFKHAIEVPGYWDDLLESFSDIAVERNRQFAEVDFSKGDAEMPPDGSLPFIVGTVWYKKRVTIPEGQAVLKLGGVMMEAWAWLNGQFVGHHFGYSTPCEFELCPDVVKSGAENELIVAVSNLREDRLGCIIRGFKGRSGGIYRSAGIEVFESMRVKDLFIYRDGNVLNWTLELAGPVVPCEVEWKIIDPCDGNVVIMSGSRQVAGRNETWDTAFSGLTPWSDNNPVVYKVAIDLKLEGKTVYSHCQSCGFRSVVSDNGKLLLNGKPVFLRGATEHAYFPETCTAPNDIEYYRMVISKFKALGFNWMRFHTWVPSEEYMQAADELGMMFQVEPPVGFGAQEYIDILKTCRRHPSVIIYCSGNEELLNESKLSYLGYIAGLQKQYAPDALYNPQEALRGIEYCWNPSDFGTPLVKEPFICNTSKLETVKEYSDVFGQYAWGQLSYTSSIGDWKDLEHKLAVYERPCLSHEVCIHGTYMDLSLQERYRGTRIGERLYESARREIERAGILDKADLFYRHSCSWAQILRKHCLENARMCSHIAGYDLLGAIDYHWHRYGYPCGVMNEFYEMKPGETVEQVLRYNGEDILLADLGTDRNFTAGQQVCFDVYSSIYSAENSAVGILNWQLTDDKGGSADCGSIEIDRLACGKTDKIAAVELTLPTAGRAGRYAFECRLKFGSAEISNSWNIWIFPEVGDIDAGRVKVFDKLDSDEVDFINDGGIGLLLGTDGLPAEPTVFQISCAGRPNGNLATVIAKHPVFEALPHDKFCDWQFYDMLQDAEAVVFNDFAEYFSPLLEIAGSFKRILKQAAVFELQVGQGRLFVCSLKLKSGNPAAQTLKAGIIGYLNGGELVEAPVIPHELLQQIVAKNLSQTKSKLGTDQGFDALGQLIPPA